MRHKIRIEGAATPEDMRAQYVYLPFEVPPANSVTIPAVSIL